MFQRETHWYGTKEEKERKKAERKFVIVITRLDENGQPSQAMHELSSRADAAVVPELPDAGDVKHYIVEMPGNEDTKPIELPGDSVLPGGVSLGYGQETNKPTACLFELEGDTQGEAKRELPIGSAETGGDIAKVLDGRGGERLDKPAN